MTICGECVQRSEIPGNYHCRCNNPPKKKMTVGHGGDERYALAAKMATDHDAIVRCIWPGSGMYPLSFDEGTVFACANFTTDEKEKVKLDVSPLTELISLLV